MKILVVDDEEDVKTLFEQRFRKEIRSNEFSIEFANSGQEALNYIHKYDQEIGLILSDINMPGMSGLELLKKIKELYAIPPPVIMMITAYGDEENYNRSLSLGADDFLTKPLDFTILKEKVKAKVHSSNITKSQA